MQRKKHKNTKKLTPQTVHLSSHFTDVDLMKFMQKTIRTRRPMKVMLDGQNHIDNEWIEVVYPKWKELWEKQGLKMRYNVKQHCFFLKYSKDLEDAYQVFLKYSK